MNLHTTCNGLPVLSARIRLSRGGLASTCEITLPPGDAPAVGASLEIALRDAAAQRTLRQLVCTGVETLGDGRRVVHGADRRSAWRGRIAALPAHGPRALHDALADLARSAGLQAADVPQSAGTLPALPRIAGSLGALIEQLCALAGASFGVDDDGAFTFAELDAAANVNTSFLINSREDSARPAEVIVLGAQPLELIRVSDWQPVLPVDGALIPLADALAQWQIDENAARQACLREGGFAALLGRTGTQIAERAALLQRYAFRTFRADGAPWLPVGGVADGALLPPRLATRASRPVALAPSHPADAAFEDAGETAAAEGFELDLERGVLRLDEPPYLLENQADPTRQSRRLLGEPRITLSIARESGAEAFRFALPAGGDGEPRIIHAPWLVPVLEDGATLNAAALQSPARELAEAALMLPASRTRVFAGAAPALAVGGAERVMLRADVSGLTSEVVEAALPAPQFPPRPPAESRAGEAVKPDAPAHQPINAFRAGPLVLRADDAIESEAVLAMEATAREDTGALELTHAGALAFPFFLASEDAAKFGRWFFVAGAEALGGSRVRVLDADNRHAEIDAEDFNAAREMRPQGLRGLLVSTGGAPEFVDCGPLISDPEGRASSLVYGADGPRISDRRGPLHLLTVVAYSPALRAYAPVLNFRDGATGNHAAHGRGLFAEGDGRALGRLAADGGPLLADAARCSKHLYGAASQPGGLYRESAGHLSTEAFFKAPGDAEHDAPLTFYRLPFAGRVPPWPPYEAQIRYDAAARHAWDGKARDGRWKIQYRVPFLPEQPPTWNPPLKPPPGDPPEDPPGEPPPEPPFVPVPLRPPREIEPAISENEIWAPSHDWVPAPSEHDEQPVTFPGPSIKSEGFAGEANGVPDVSLGGGVAFLPPTRTLAVAGSDTGARDTWLVLHPEVSLGFGFPGVGEERLLDGWAVQLDEGDLRFEARDVDGSRVDDNSRGVALDGHLRFEAQSESAADALWADAQNRLRWGEGALALLSQLAPVVLGFEGTGESGNEVELAGIHRAHTLVLMGAGNGKGIALALPGGATGALTFKATASGSNVSGFSLDAPGAGAAQTLTINNTDDEWNEEGESYALLVLGARV